MKNSVKVINDKILATWNVWSILGEDKTSTSFPEQTIFLLNTGKSNMVDCIMYSNLSTIPTNLLEWWKTNADNSIVYEDVKVHWSRSVRTEADKW